MRNSASAGAVSDRAFLIDGRCCCTLENEAGDPSKSYDSMSNEITETYSETRRIEIFQTVYAKQKGGFENLNCKARNRSYSRGS